MGLAIAAETDGIHQEKQNLRKHFQENLAKLPIDLIHDQSQAIASFLKPLVHDLAPNNIASFMSLPQEPRLDEFHELSLTDSSRNLFLPRVLGSGEMKFYRWKPESSEFQIGAFGIREPVSDEVARPSEIDVVLVPALAFDPSGNRLGRGKAYYDRFLKESQALKIGLGFSCQWSEDLLPVEDHDQKMDFVITERGVVQINKKES